MTAGTVDVAALVTGRTVLLANVPDKVFSSGALGQGLGIVPAEGRVYAPVSVTVLAAMGSGHAYGIRSPEGVEVLVHIGIDTVDLDGRGFRPAVEQGQDVRAGDLLTEVDLVAVAEAGYDPTTVLLITNTAQLTAVAPVANGEVRHGQPAVTVQV